MMMIIPLQMNSAEALLQIDRRIKRQIDSIRSAQERGGEKGGSRLKMAIPLLVS